MYPELSIDEFLARLASSAPEPGGGSAAALVGAAAAALVSMVTNLTIGKDRYAAVQAQMEQARARGEALRAELVAAIDRDAEAFRRVMAAYRLPRETDEQKAARKQATQAALRDAAQVPAEVVGLCEEVAGWSQVVAEKGNVQVVSDAAVAAILADAAAQSAALNVRINLGPMGSPAEAEPLWGQIESRLERIRAARDHALRIARERIG
ncbi:MAG: cyclodeaminase/cyclohydrolase family protein [Armatimonadetes bacterium]|nr:cyclodeaminase/cyclohydrolase family protein [Armatimonadota bacterium]